MGSTHSRSVTGNVHQDVSRAVDISAQVRAEFTLDDIHCPDNTRRAQMLQDHDKDRFRKYRNFFKNHHMALAREVGRNTNKSKGELLRWVEDAVGALDEGAKYTKVEILEIAMVSVALTKYTESALAKMYDRGELDALPNVPLHTQNLRMPAKQQACRDSSNSANKAKLEAAHYIGLEVMLRLNERLPIEQRIGEELREILNHPSNLRLVLATSNQILHKKVDAMLINAKAASDSSGSSNQQCKVSMREYKRLVQIAKHAQDESFQDAMIAVNGHYLYDSLRQQFNLLDVGERPKLWESEKDKLELRHVPRSRSRSPSPALREPRVPLSPAKKRDPESRIRSSTASSPEKKSRNPFSRLARMFHSRSTPKPQTPSARSSATSGPMPREPSRLSTCKKQVKETKRRPQTKATTSHQTPTPTRPRTAARKTAKKAVSDDSADSSSDDSDYVDEDVNDVEKDDRILHVGPRGGTYYINATGKKVYAKAG